MYRNAFIISFVKTAITNIPAYNKEDMRSHIGVAGILRDEDGNILIQNHNKFKFNTLPVGKAKPDESALQALKTEMREELGVNVQKAKLVGRKTFTYDRKGIPVDVDLHVFDVEKYRGTPVNAEPEKHKWIKFMSPEKVKRMRNVSDALLFSKELGGI